MRYVDPFLEPVDPSLQPSEWLLSMRRLAIFLWFSLLVFLVAKAAILDICGAVSLAILMLVGYAVPFGSQQLKVLNSIRYGAASLFFCGTDTVVGILHIIHWSNGWDSYYPLVGFVTPGWPHEIPPEKLKQQSILGKYLSAMSLFAVVVSILLPILEACISFHCYKIYKEQRRISLAAERADEETRLRGSQLYGAPAQNRSQQRDQQHTRAYKPFEGRKLRLPDD
eukprot:gnl/MRDRNA2_/MRDRNA2_121994_c0_seq1.p1 gnl/MRDRNA2_/MRDRNA2_121994_c0~~gnl/MRDRNA2_/MRDRNA2_121994_c0_seq1.p1  ORF type:complete len:225 (-),score=30.12 gnl/MRDRNA2_/MRDRNA2_121994_c0_seq1:171-845(-)